MSMLKLDSKHGASPSVERHVAGILVRYANRYGVVATNAWRERGFWVLDSAFGVLTLRQLAERIGEYDENLSIAP